MDDVRRDFTEEEIRAAKHIVTTLNQVWDNEEKKTRILAAMIRDWNIDLEERDKIIAFYVKRSDRAKLKHARHKQKLRQQKVDEVVKKNNCTRSSTG